MPSDQNFNLNIFKPFNSDHMESFLLCLSIRFSVLLGSTNQVKFNCYSTANTDFKVESKK